MRFGVVCNYRRTKQVYEVGMVGRNITDTTGYGRADDRQAQIFTLYVDWASFHENLVVIYSRFEFRRRTMTQ